MNANDFLKKFPGFAKRWSARKVRLVSGRSTWTGYSHRLEILKASREPDADGLYHLEIRQKESGEKYVWYFKPPTDPRTEEGFWGPKEMIAAQERTAKQ